MLGKFINCRRTQPWSEYMKSSNLHIVKFVIWKEVYVYINIKDHTARGMVIGSLFTTLLNTDIFLRLPFIETDHCDILQHHIIVLFQAKWFGWGRSWWGRAGGREARIKILTKHGFDYQWSVWPEKGRKMVRFLCQLCSEFISLETFL